MRQRVVLTLCLLLLCPTLTLAQVSSMRIRDGVQPGEADVLGSSPAGTEQGLVTRPIPGSAHWPVDASQAGTWTVQQGTPPWSVSQSGSWTVEQGTPPWVIRLRDASGTDVASVGADGSLKVDNSSHTQPVSGTITANQGGSPWAIRLQDASGSTQVVVTGAGALKVDGSAVTQPVSIAGTVTVSGTVSVNALPAGSNTIGSVKLTDGTDTAQVTTTNGGSLQVECAAGCGAPPSFTDNSTFTPGSDSVAPVAGTYRATRSALTDGNAGAVALNAKRGLFVTLEDAASNELASATSQPAGTELGLITRNIPSGTQDVNCTSGCSGGTQYDQGTATTATDKLSMAGAVRHDTATVDGGVADGDRVTLSTDASGRLRTTAADTTQPVSGTVTVQQSTASNLKVDLSGTGANATAIKVDGSAVTQPVSGTVTANAGTNLNTSALALDATVGRAQESTTSGQTGPLVQGAVTASAPTYTTAKSDPLSLQTDGSLRTAVTNTVTVSGTVTANAGSGTFYDGIIRDGTGDTTQANVSSGRLQVDGSGVTQPISGSLTNISGTISLPTGASTLAEQQTQTTSLQLIDDVVHSNDAALGKVAAVGCQFDDTSPGTTTENNVRAVRCSTRREVYNQIRDAAGNERGANVTAGNALVVDGSASTQPISGTVTVQQSTASNLKVDLSGTAANSTAIKVDGSAVTQPISGSLTNISGTISLPTGASTFAEQQTQTTSLQLIDDIVHSNDAALGKVAAVGCQFDDTSPGTTTENNVRAVRCSTRRELYQQIRDAAGNERGVNVTAGNALVVDGSASTQPVSGTVSITSNSSVNVNQIAGSTVSTAASGVQKVGIVGNTGVAVDGTVAAGSAPTNQVVVGSVYNTTAPAPTNGQTMAQQADQAGNLRITQGIALATLSVWNSGTSINTTQNIFTNSGTGAVLMHLVQSSGTFSVGAITFEVTYDNSNWVTIPADAVLDPSSTTYAQISLPYTLVTSTNKPFLLVGKGWQGVRIKLSTAITGTGTVTPNYALLGYEPASTVVALSPTAANFNATVTASNLQTNVAQFGGTNVSTGTGAGGSGIPRVTISNDSSLAANQSVNVAQINGVATTMNNGAAGTGVQRVTIANDSTGIIQPVPGTAGGLLISRTVAGASTNATNVKASAGQVYQILASNVNASARFVHLYNTSGTPSCGSSIIATFIVPGNTAGAGTNIQLDPGWTFGTGIGFCITTSNDGTGSVSASDVVLMIGYK